MQLGAWLGLNAPQLAQTLRRRAGVTAVAGVAPQLTADGAGAAALKAGYGPDAPALLAQRCQRHSVFWLQVFVSRSHLRTLPSVRVLHFRFETALNKTSNIMVVVEADGSRVALLVDELLGQHQVVVKNLESNYRKVPNVSGATILGDGTVALILDIGGLVRRARH